MSTDDFQRGALPIPDLAYTGTVTYDATSPDTHYPPINQVHAPENAPNVLVILLDDVGFGASSSFGGPIETPTFDRLAEDGLRFTRFHTTALCSPTRAALLSGRNHHTVGMGGITEIATSAPGYNSLRPNSCAPIAEILRLNGYSTSQFGKCHEVPVWEASPIGPFDHWPSPGGGFEYFFGFIGGETNQWYPAIYENTSAVEPWGTPEQGYHFMDDMTDKAISWIKQQKSLAPDKPFFTYFAPGATHAPHHVPEGVGRPLRREVRPGLGRAPRGDVRAAEGARRGSRGCSADRAERGHPGLGRDVRPHQARAVARDGGVRGLPLLRRSPHRPADRCDRGARDPRRHARVRDHRRQRRVGRGQLHRHDERGLHDQPHDELEDEDYMVAHKDDLGTPNSYNHYAIGWAHAMDTPYQWTKQVASHFGGTRNGTIVHWPGGIKATGEIRNQFCHCIDVAPTILEAAGIPEPNTVHGVTQRPMEGTSMAYTFDDADRRRAPHDPVLRDGGEPRHLPPRLDGGRQAQGSVARLVARRRGGRLGALQHRRRTGRSRTISPREHPDKLAELQNLFLIQAARFNVLPLDTRSAERFNSELVGRPELIKGTSQTLYSGMTRLKEDSVIVLKNKSHTISAAIEVPARRRRGRALRAGWDVWRLEPVPDRRPAGLLLQRPRHRALQDRKRLSRSGRRARGAGRVRVRRRRARQGRHGDALRRRRQIGTGHVDRTLPFMFSMDETADVGSDLASPVSDDYGPAGNEFNGRIEWIRLDAGDDSHDHLVDPAHQMHIAMVRQ